MILGPHHLPRPVVSLVLVLVFACVSVSCTGCSPVYVTRAALKETSILWNREKIVDVIEGPNVTTNEKVKLRLITEVRKYAENLGLTPGGSFLYYSPVEGEALTWVVVGSELASFNFKTWWFPIVGSVPYKGYFEKEDAVAEATFLEKQGYETAVRGADAFSTLGWFNDPVVTPMLNNSDFDIVTTVIHESVHSTVWIKDHVEFNESLAQFVGLRGMEAFYASRPQSSEAAAMRTLQFDVAESVEHSVSELEGLYTSSITKAEKIARRDAVFQSSMSRFRKKYPELPLMRTLNNAELLQRKFYCRKFDLFQLVFDSVNANFTEFIQKINEVKAQVDRDPSVDPFDALQKLFPAPS